jgi:hypothetical protein
MLKKAGKNVIYDRVEGRKHTFYDWWKMKDTLEFYAKKKEKHTFKTHWKSTMH